MTEFMRTHLDADLEAVGRPAWVPRPAWAARVIAQGAQGRKLPSLWIAGSCEAALQQEVASGLGPGGKRESTTDTSTPYCTLPYRT